MKKVFVFMALLLMISYVTVNAQVADTTVTKAKAARWFKKKKWLNGVALEPHKSINKKEFIKQYRINQAYWDAAFAFLKNNNLQTLAKGKYPIDGDNVFASVTEDPTRELKKTNWESHRKYIDIQCVITGTEKMGKWPVADVTTITKPYDEAKDVANYKTKGKYYAVRAGTFIIFFPGDAHRPNITTGGNKVVKKIVIKVRAA